MGNRTVSSVIHVIRYNNETGSLTEGRQKTYKINASDRAHVTLQTLDSARSQPVTHTQWFPPRVRDTEDL